MRTSHRLFSARLSIRAFLHLGMAGWAMVVTGWADEASMAKVLAEFARDNALREAAGQPLLTLHDLFARYSDDDKRRILRHAALSGNVLPGLPGIWPLIDDAAVALPNLRHEREPLTPATLESLERCTRNQSTDQELLQVQAVLYRYARPGAREWLLARLQQRACPEAALILALNRETEVLPEISRLRGPGRMPAGLVLALGEWDGAADELLNELFVTDPANPNVVTALASGSHRLLEPAVKLLEERHAGEQAGRGAAHAAVLLRNGPNPGRYVDYLCQILKSDQGDRAGAFWGLVQAGRLEAKPHAARLLEEFLRKGRPIAFGHLHVEALKAILMKADANDWALAFRVLDSLPAPSHSPGRAMSVTVATEVYRAASAEDRARIARALSDEFSIARLDAVTLRRLPASYLPDSSKRIDWGMGYLSDGMIRSDR